MFTKGANNSGANSKCVSHLQHAPKLPQDICTDPVLLQDVLTTSLISCFQNDKNSCSDTVRILFLGYYRAVMLG